MLQGRSLEYMEQGVPAFSLRKTQYEKQPKAYGNSNCR